MKRILLIAFILSITAITACTKHYKYRSCYVGCYYIPKSLTAKVSGKSPNFEISVVPTYGTCYNLKLGSSQQGEEYSKYAEYYGDTNFMRDDDDYGGVDVSCNPLASISVTCNQDWDSEHPAETVLNDLIATDVQSFKKKLESGYKESSNFFYYNRLTDIDYTSIRPYGKVIYLYMPSSAGKQGKYEFTIAVGFDEDPITGKKVSVEPVTVEIEF